MNPPFAFSVSSYRTPPTVCFASRSRAGIVRLPQMNPRAVPAAPATIAEATVNHNPGRHHTNHQPGRPDSNRGPPVPRITKRSRSRAFGP
jgi:hypothetical protein